MSQLLHFHLSPVAVESKEPKTVYCYVPCGQTKIYDSKSLDLLNFKYKDTKAKETSLTNNFDECKTMFPNDKERKEERTTQLVIINLNVYLQNQLISKLSPTYAQHLYSLDVGQHFERSAIIYIIAEQNMDLVEDNKQYSMNLKFILKKKTIVT